MQNTIHMIQDGQTEREIHTFEGREICEGVKKKKANHHKVDFDHLVKR